MILLILKILIQACQNQIKKSNKDIGIYNIGYITTKKIGNCKSIYSINPLYLRINHAHGCIESISAEEENKNKCLIFDSIELHSIDENKTLLEKYNDAFNGIRDKIKKMSNDDCDYEKYYMKIKFNSDNNLPINKPLNFHSMTINIRSVFKEDGKFYPQVYLDNTVYELSSTNVN